ncbi:MAG: hypothetical protein RLZZ631_1594 [Cyanobacteriota bacterium]
MTEQNNLNPLQLLNRYRLESFHAHCSLIDQLFLKTGLESAASRLACPEENQSWVALMVDDRPTQLARICALNTLLMTRFQAEIRILTAPGKVQAFQELMAPWLQWIKIGSIEACETLDTLGWGGYNKLFKDPNFWRSLAGKQILVFQSDSLLIEPLELEELKYDYVGAPWNKGRITSSEFPTYTSTGKWNGSEWINQALCQTTPDHNNGNGGLSIRSARLMEKICADHAAESPEEEAEDIFFARHIHAGEYSGNLPSQRVLRQIFNETTYSDSHGFHGSWFYLDGAEQAKLYEKHVKHIIGLLTARSR